MVPIMPLMSINFLTIFISHKNESAGARNEKNSFLPHNINAAVAILSTAAFARFVAEQPNPRVRDTVRIEGKRSKAKDACSGTKCHQ